MMNGMTIQVSSIPICVPSDGVTGSIRLRAFPIANAEVNNDREYRQSDGAAEENERDKNRVDTRRVARVLIGKQRKIHLGDLPASDFFADSIQSE